MGILGRFFKKSAKKVITRFDQLSKITTRALPIPGFEPNSANYIVIIAKKLENNLWKIEGCHNGAPFTEGLEAADTAFRHIIAHHTGKKIEDIRGGGQVVDFDVAFKVLREMEETLLKHCGYLPDPEPRNHFMTAYRLLPQPFQAEIDTGYFQNLREKGWSLPPAEVLTNRQGPKAPPKP